jgi:deazaflavin-dependent oxidoreductase (nitroreductase family)
MTTVPGTDPSHPTDSTEGWVAKNIAAYLATDGRKGGSMSGVPLLLLTTQGAKSGLWRRTVLIFGEHEGNLIVVASVGGAPKHPSWYLNLVANPAVWVQVGADRFEATARTASPEERPALWKKMAELFPNYDGYQRKTSREIPVVILEPRQQPEGR